MRRYFLITLLLMCGVVFGVSAKSNYTESDLFESVEQGDKVALLMVHFGTSHNDTRAKTIEALNDMARTKYPSLELREAWTSRMIIRIMGKRGEKFETPLEALERLREDGFTHVIVQSSNVIEGVEMESLRRDVLSVEVDFKGIRVGAPLLYHTSDYEQVVDMLHAKRPNDGALILVGHGTYTPATAQYSMVDYVIRDRGYERIHIGTIEGYPTFETMLSNLKRDGVKDVVLMPFMFVCGEHAKNDISGEWAKLLRDEGYNVSVIMEGLGEQSVVQQILMDHIDFSIKNKMYDIIEKKSGYLRGETF